MTNQQRALSEDQFSMTLEECAEAVAHAMTFSVKNLVNLILKVLTGEVDD